MSKHVHSYLSPRSAGEVPFSKEQEVRAVLSPFFTISSPACLDRTPPAAAGRQGRPTPLAACRRGPPHKPRSSLRSLAGRSVGALGTRWSSIAAPACTLVFLQIEYFYSIRTTSGAGWMDGRRRGPPPCRGRVSACETDRSRRVASIGAPVLFPAHRRFPNPSCPCPWYCRRRAAFPRRSGLESP